MKMKEEWRTKYQALIDWRLQHPVSGDEDCHEHHVVPKFSKSPRNKLVKLTHKEHCLAHFYLWRGFKESKVKKNVDYLRAAYKGLSIAFGEGPDKAKLMRQFQKDIEAKIKEDMK